MMLNAYHLIMDGLRICRKLQNQAVDFYGDVVRVREDDGGLRYYTPGGIRISNDLNGMIE